MRFSFMKAVYIFSAVLVAGCLAATIGTRGYFDQLMGRSDIPAPRIYPITFIWSGIGLVAIAIGILFSLEYFLRDAKIMRSDLSRIVASIALSLFIAYGFGRILAVVHGPNAKVTVVRVKLDRVTDVAIFYETEYADYVGVELNPDTHKLGKSIYELTDPMNKFPGLTQVSQVHYKDLR
jgi:hypothetical protein